MEWSSFIMGGLSVLMTYAMFKGADTIEEAEDIEREDDDLEIHGFEGRSVTLSCQTCRKLKKHNEVKPGLFQCTKCKRHVDLRR